VPLVLKVAALNGREPGLDGEFTLSSLSMLPIIGALVGNIMGQ